MEKYRYNIVEDEIFNIISPIRLVTWSSAHLLVGTEMIYQPKLTQIYQKRGHTKSIFLYSNSGNPGLFCILSRDFRRFEYGKLEENLLNHVYDVDVEDDAINLCLADKFRINSVLNTSDYPKDAYRAYPKFKEVMDRVQADCGQAWLPSYEYDELKSKVLYGTPIRENHEYRFKRRFNSQAPLILAQWRNPHK